MLRICLLLIWPGLISLLHGTIGVAQDNSVEKARAAITSPVDAVADATDSVAVQLELTPAALTLRKTARADVLMVVRNTGTQKLQEVKFLAIHSLPIDIIPTGSVSREIVPGSAELWHLAVSQNRSTPATGEVYIGVSYQWLNAKGELHSDVKFEKLTLTPPAKPVVTELAGLTVYSSLKSVSQRQPGIVHLSLANISDRRLTLEALTAYGPVTRSGPGPQEAFLTFSVEGREVGRDQTNVSATRFLIRQLIEPGDTMVIPVEVSAKMKVSPGQYQLLFQAHISWDNVDPVYSGEATLIETHEISAGVLGESTIYDYIGVPSILFLPGFLMVLTWRLLWSLGLRLNKNATDFLLQLKDPNFYLVAVTLSGLAAVAYPLIAKRDYLTTYGPDDVAYLWVGSIGVATVLYLITYGAGCGIRWCWRGTSIRVTDTALEVLNKLSPLKLGVMRDPVKVKIHGNKYTGFLLEETGGQMVKETRYLVAPRIVVRMSADTPNKQSILESLEAMIAVEQSRHGDVGKLAEAVSTAVDRNVAKVDWIEDENWLDKPYYLNSELIELTGGDPQLVEVVSEPPTSPDPANP